MPSKIEQAKKRFKFWLDNYFQPLLDNKNKIIHWLGVLGECVSWNDKLFKYPLIQLYEFLEDDFWPRIRLIEKQINEWKLSKRKYINLREDTFYNNTNVFLKHIWYMDSYSKNYKSDIYFYIRDNNNEEGNFAYRQIFENFLFLKSTISALKDIINYWVEKEEDEYYYFEWYNIENKSTVTKNKDIIFSFEKSNKILYIVHISTSRKFKIKTVELDSPYDSVSNYMVKNEKNILIKNNIEKESKIKITEWLSDTKKYIWFQRILRTVFCEWATKDKLVFYRDITKDRLIKIDITEKEVLEHLEEKFW